FGVRQAESFPSSGPRFTARRWRPVLGRTGTGRGMSAGRAPPSRIWPDHRRMLILTESDIRALVTIDDALEAARAAFIALSAGTAVVPPRTIIPVVEGTALFMPAVDRAGGIAGVKVVSVHPENPGRGLPTVQ